MSPFAGAVLAAVAAGAITISLGWRARSRPQLATSGAGVGEPLRMLRRLGASPIVRRVGVSARTRRSLALSGLRLGVRDVATLKVLAVGTAVISCSLVAPVLLPLSILAYRGPDLLVSRRARRRLRMADREIPVLLDLLAVATSAGLPPQLSFRKAVDAAEGPLADELRSVVNATSLGGRWRDELRSTSDRLRLPDLQRLVGALTRSETLGSSLVEEIPRLASDVREARASDAIERARAAPVKMLFPLVFLILPAFLLLTVVPVLVTTVRSIG